MGMFFTIIVFGLTKAFPPALNSIVECKRNAAHPGNERDTADRSTLCCIPGI